MPGTETMFLFCWVERFCLSLYVYMFSYNVGVVAFIEVRSNTENRFDGISKQVEMLGATVSKSHHADPVISCFWISGGNKFSHFIFISLNVIACV